MPLPAPDKSAAAKTEVAELKRKIALRSSDPKTVRMLIGALVDADQPEEAELYAEALDLMLPESAAVKSILGALYQRNGRLSSAALVFRQLVTLKESDADAWVQYAMALAQAGYLHQAAEAYRRAFNLDLKHHFAISQYFYLSNYAAAHPELIQTFRGILARKGAPLGARAVACRFLAMTVEQDSRAGGPRFPATVEDWRTWRNPVELRAWIDAATAWFAAEPKDHDAAEQYLCASLLDTVDARSYTALQVMRSAWPGHVCNSYEAAGGFYRALDAASLAEMLRDLPPTRTVAETAVSAEACYFIGCDQGYFDRFVPALVGSAMMLNGQHGLHIHVFNGDDARLRQAFAAMTAAHPMPLRITSETIALKENEDRIYYHAIRFARFAEFQPLYGDCWVVDADFLFAGDTAPMLRRLKDGDVSFSFLQGRLEPHNQIGAGAVGFAATPAARRFARMIGGYLVQMWSNGRLRWGADQAALYLVLRYLMSTGAEIRPTGILDFTGELGDPRAVLVSSKLPEGAAHEAEVEGLRQRALAFVGLQ